MLDVGTEPRTSGIPPIEFEDLPDPLADRLRPRVERLGYLGEFFRRTAHQPDALLAFCDFTEASKDALGQPLTEVVALTASVALGNDYERHQHERLSLALGKSREWVAAVEQRESSDRTLLSEHERDAQDVVSLVLDNHGIGTNAVVEAYAATYGAPAAVALLLVIGRYQAHAVVVNALEFEPPVPSIFESGATRG